MLSPTLASLGFDLIEVVVRPHPTQGLVRIYIDRLPTDDATTHEGVNVDDCALASGHIAALLDVEDPMPGKYNLEVSSPGVNRPLRTPEHYQAALEQKVKIHLFAPITQGEQKRRRLNGVLKAVTEDGVQVEIEQQFWEATWSQIERGNSVADIDFSNIK